MHIEWNDPETALAAIGSKVGMWRWDFETNRVQWSEYLLEMLGIDQSDFVEDFSTFEALLHPDDNGLIQDRIDIHLKTGEPYKFRCRLRHADGHYITLLSQGSALFGPDGTPSELIGTVVDVSDEVRYLSELTDAKTTFQSLSENVPGAIFRYLIHPDGTDEVEYMSPGCFDIWELSATEIQGDPYKLWDMVLDEDLAGMQGSVMASAADLVPWLHRWRVRTPTGVLKHLEGRGIPELLEDGGTRWNSLITDVTREAEAQEELLAQQQMLGQAQKMESIGRIAGGIAHDFNNLLAIIMGNAELIGDGKGSENNSEFTADIINACQRGSKLTRQLLSFARRSQLHPEVVNVDQAIKEVSALVERIIPENISVDKIGTAGLWWAELDIAFLENAIINLCINARDAMPDGGQLTIETSNVRITRDYADEYGEVISPGRYVLVAISDTGVGISKSQIAQVVEPFYSTKGPDRGSGLGLAMVDGFVRQSKGALRIYSEVGVGTAVKLYLPAISGPEKTKNQSQPVTPMEHREGVRERILVVEDEEGIRNIVRLTLARAGYDVYVASSGDEAWRLFEEEKQRFDVLLTDIVMPGKLQGPALAGKVTAIAPETRVVFMSGYPNEAAVEGNGLRVTDRFLMKPIMRHELLRTLADSVKAKAY